MEEGSLRCDANVSVREAGEEGYRTKTELKNMNSFRFLERGIEAEIARQIATWESGGTVVQETLHFDPVTGSLTPLRSKEEVHDYRYFPEPDLVPVAPTEEMLERARAALPELPAARLERYRADYGLADDVAGTLVGWSELGRFFEESVAAGERQRGRDRAVDDGRAGRVPARAGHRGPARVEALAATRSRSWSGWSRAARSPGRAAKEVLGELTAEGGDPAAIVEARGLAPIADSGRAGGDRRARDRGEPGARSSRSAAARRRRRARSWAR